MMEAPLAVSTKSPWISALVAAQSEGEKPKYVVTTDVQRTGIR